MKENAADKSVRVSVRDVFFILFYKLRVFVITFVVIAGLVTAYAWTATPIYEAFGSVLLKPLHDSRELLHNELGRFQVEPVSQEDLNSEIQIMTSEILLEKVVDEVGLDKNDYFIGEKSFLDTFFSTTGEADNSRKKALAKLKKKLVVTPVTMSNIIEVTFRGPDPRVGSDIINTLFELYVDRHIELRKSGNDVGFYREQIGVAAQSLTEAEDALLAFQEKWSLIQIEAQREQNVQLMRLLGESLSIVKSEIAEYARKMSIVDSKLAKGEPLPMTEEFRSNDTFLALLRNLSPLLIERERIAILYPEDSVEYQDAANQVERIQGLLDREQQKLLNGIRVDLEARIERKDVLEEEFEKVRAESVLLTQKEVEFERLKRNVEINKRNYALYFDKREEARIESVRDKARVANISINSRASVPSTPVFPRKGLMVLFAVLSGSFAGIACTFASYAMDHSIKRPEDVSRWFDLPVFAALETVPTMRER